MQATSSEGTHRGKVGEKKKGHKEALTPMAELRKRTVTGLGKKELKKLQGKKLLNRPSRETGGRRLMSERKTNQDKP